VTGLVDTQEAFLLDVIEGRDAADLDKWLGVQDQQWLEGVTSVAIDLHEGFRHGLVGHLDHATLVADPFHVVAVRHEAPCIRVGCNDPPPDCRSSPVKLRAA